jgi:hypothetical protein
MGTVNISGSVSVDGSGCATSCGGTGQDRLTVGLGDGVCSKTYETVLCTANPITVATVGALGAAWADIDFLSELDEIEFLLVRSSTDVVLRIGAAAAVLTGVGGVFPSGFAGGETLIGTLDGVPFTVTFTVGAQTAAQVATEINGALALLGIATPRAAVASSGQLTITGVLTGAEGTVTTTGGTGAAAIGLSAASAVGDGEDIAVSGLFLSEFVRRNATYTPSRIQVSGSASLTIVAGGRTSA